MNEQEILINRETFKRIVQGMMKVCDKKEDISEEGSIIYTYNDLMFEGEKAEGKLIPKRCAIQLFNNIYYIELNGKVYTANFVESGTNNIEDDQFVINYVNDNPKLMKSIETFLQWRINILEKLSI